MKISSLSELAVTAKQMQRKTVIAVVQAQDYHTLESVIAAARDGIAEPMLIGDAGRIRAILSELGAEPEGFEIIGTDGAEQSLKLAADAINAGRAGAVMKGMLESGEFMSAVVNRDNGLIDGETKRLTLAGLFDPPGYHKIFAVSDMALNTYPDLAVKRAIIENAVEMLRALGTPCPKVAVLAAVDRVNPKMPETVDADALKQMNIRGELRNCVVEGPISFDLATSAEAARIKAYESPVAGDADIMIVPDIASGNIFVKTLTGLAGSHTAGTVLGARVPVILTSRSAEASDKYYSIALAACVSAGMRGDY